MSRTKRWTSISFLQRINALDCCVNMLLIAILRNSLSWQCWCIYRLICDQTGGKRSVITVRPPWREIVRIQRMGLEGPQGLTGQICVCCWSCKSADLKDSLRGGLLWTLWSEWARLNKSARTRSVIIILNRACPPSPVSCYPANFTTYINSYLVEGLITAMMH